MDTTEQPSDFRPAPGDGGEAPTAADVAAEVGQEPGWPTDGGPGTGEPTDDGPGTAPEGSGEGAGESAGDEHPPEAAAEDGQPPAAEVVVAAEARSGGTPRRQSRFIAELTRAMHAAAEDGRAGTLEQLHADGKSAVEAIQSRSAEDAAGMRHRADEDIAGIREWSKAEIARIREETEHRIAARKETLDHELEGHAAVVEAEIENVQSQVSTFEGEMDSFFQGLLAEEDPGRFAALAANMPEPSPFAPLTDAQRAEIAARASGIPAEAPEAAGTAEGAEAAEADAEAAAESDQGLAAPDLAAAERDALAGVSADGQEAAGFPGGSISARLAGLTGSAAAAGGPAEGAGDGSEASTQVVVTGLTSVSSIAAFKRQLGRLDGVRTVAVSSGPSGEFIFAVVHDGSVVVADGVRSLGGFSPEVTRAEVGLVEVTAHDPEA